MRKVFIIMLSALLLLTSCSKRENAQSTSDSRGVAEMSSVDASSSEISSPASQDELKVSDFFPLTKDVHIKYKGTGNEYAEYETYVEYIKDNIVQMRDANPGTSSVLVYEIGGGMLKRVYDTHEVYYRYDFTSLKGDGEILIKEPIKVGNSWTLKDGATRTITAVDKDIKTPLSEYRALEITTENQDSTVTEYYVKDIGLVKRTFTPKGSSDVITSEIEKIEKDVPFKHNVRFYFPDYINQKIVYIDRIVEINTDQDMKWKFQKELKTIPGGSDLSKVLTKDVQVLGSIVNEKDKSVTVNFSSQLVRDMNAGAGLESMILQCIANTFGEYYQVDKVIITIEGNPYSSGHILMKPGQYFKVDTAKAVKY